MSEGEDDYMSDKFLSGAADIRPSLIQDRGKKRQVEIATKKEGEIKRAREDRLDRFGLRNERLQESLKRPIEANNKGFQLLAKMGYTPGQALGKGPPTSSHSANSSEDKRIKEPISITIKTDRGGFGREAALLELSERRQQLRHLRLCKAGGGKALTTEEYRKRATQKAEERFVLNSLRRCQLTCENLDTESKVEVPEMTWFWPERQEETKDESTEPDCEAVETENKAAEDEFTNGEKLEMLTAYLRTAYTFCFWCGVRYQDQQDMDSSCPGLTRDDH